MNLSTYRYYIEQPYYQTVFNEVSSKDFLRKEWLSKFQNKFSENFGGRVRFIQTCRITVSNFFENLKLNSDIFLGSNQVIPNKRKSAGC